MLVFIDITSPWKCTPRCVFNVVSKKYYVDQIYLTSIILYILIVPLANLKNIDMVNDTNYSHTDILNNFNITLTCGPIMRFIIKYIGEMK